MSDDITPADRPVTRAGALRADAERWVRRKRILYTVIGVYLALSVLWFSIDMADGTENIWFHWPMLGVGIAVAVTAIVLFGVGGVFGVGWEARQIDRYMAARRRTDDHV
jgi:hypothetical protein